MIEFVFRKKNFGRAKIGGEIFLSMLKLPNRAKSQSPGIFIIFMFIFFLFRVKCISTIFFILFSLPTSINNRRGKESQEKAPKWANAGHDPSSECM